MTEPSPPDVPGGLLVALGSAGAPAPPLPPATPRIENPVTPAEAHEPPLVDAVPLAVPDLSLCTLPPTPP